MATTGSRRGPAVRRHGRVRTATGAHRASSSARFASTSTRIVSTAAPAKRWQPLTWTSTATGARAAPRARHRTAPNQGSQVPPAAAATGRAALRPCSDRARCASSIERRPVREERRRTGVARYHVAATLDVETSETVRNRRPRQSRPRTATRAGSSGATAAPASRLQKRRRARFESGARFASTSTAAPTR